MVKNMPKLSMRISAKLNLLTELLLSKRLNRAAILLRNMAGTDASSPIIKPDVEFFYDLAVFGRNRFYTGSDRLVTAFVAAATPCIA